MVDCERFSVFRADHSRVQKSGHLCFKRHGWGVIIWNPL